MNLQEMLSILEEQSGRTLHDEQRSVIEHTNGPLWVIAGPGSGKTEVLVLRCLKLTCVDKVAPKAIILTTFTELDFVHLSGITDCFNQALKKIGGDFNHLVVFIDV